MMRPKPNLKRDDGTLWESSYKDEASAMASLFNRDLPQFYFRELTENPRKKWWKLWEPKFIRTGNVWEGSGMIGDAGFSLINR